MNSIGEDKEAPSVLMSCIRPPCPPPSPVLSCNVADLRLDPNFSSLLDRASEVVRRRVISIFTDGGGVVVGDGSKTSPVAKEDAGDASAAASVAGLASMVEVQEREIAGLREELSEALSRIPRGGGEDGGVSALEEALRNQVQYCCCVEEALKLV